MQRERERKKGGSGGHEASTVYLQVSFRTFVKEAGMAFA